MTYDPDNPLGLSASALADVDEICAQFERAWQADAPPRIASYLDLVSDDSRAALLRELILLDVDYRRQRGERPQPVDYADLTPAASALLDTGLAHTEKADTVTEARDEQSVPATPTVPKRLGRYEVIERIGSGGFGTVYRAHDAELQRDVAIKVPHRHVFHRAAAIVLFREEARALATLRHPAIVPVFDVHFEEEDPSSCYVVSQFMEGGDLATFVETQTLTPAEAARIMRRAAEALHYAHRRGLVHRDVKLSNILRDADGQIYIADFGLALRDDEFGRGDGFAGTPANMSPEQARGDADLVDGRTDVYGLGVVLYELLSGTRPFTADTVPELLDQIQTLSPKPPRQLNDQIPRELERICLKAVAKQPADRYTTALDMAHDLRQFDRRQRAATSTWNGPKALVSVCLIIVALATAWRMIVSTGTSASQVHSGTLPLPSVRSLAVLPFKAVGDAEQSDYVGLGMADSLITKLTNAQQIVVRPTESVRQYTDGVDDPLAAGRVLRVDAVLDGSIQQTENRTVATARLLRVADGKPLWTSTFDEASRDLFALQDAISAEVTRALALQLTSKERDRVQRRHTESRQAYEAYIKGRYHWNQRDLVGPSEIRKAITYFKEAIDADPLYALAYAGLAESHALMNIYRGTLDEEAFPRARAAANKALEIDEDLTEAHATLAFVTCYYDWDWERADQKFRRAIELNPNHATAHQWYGEMLYWLGRFDESIVQLKRAAELDPLSSVIKSLQGMPYLYRRDYDRARQEFLKAEDVNPKSVLSLHGLATCYEHESRFEEALACYQKQGYLPGQGYALGKLGQRNEALQIRQQLMERRPYRCHPYHIAIIYMGLDEFDKVFEWLEKARKAHDEHMVWLKVDPKFDPLREDPRFIQLLKDFDSTK